MTPSKAIYFLIELITCYGSVYYSNFLYFYMKIRFGFGGLENLLLAALSGFVYLRGMARRGICTTVRLHTGAVLRIFRPRGFDDCGACPEFPGRPGNHPRRMDRFRVLYLACA